MWGRKEEGSGSGTPAAQPAPSAPPAQKPAAQPRSAPTSASSPAIPTRTAERKGGQAQIGKSLKVKGTVTGHEDLYVDGEIEGTIELEQNSLTVGPNGIVSADVAARDITILGRVTGNVRAGERVEIRKTGSLEGDLTTSRIVIEDGAVFRGSIDIAKPEAAAPKPAASAAAASAPQKSEKAVAEKSGR